MAGHTQAFLQLVDAARERLKEIDAGELHERLPERHDASDFELCAMDKLQNTEAPSSVI